MKAEDIEGRKTLEAWLETRPRQDAVVIAHRAALRVLPIWGAAMGEDWAIEDRLSVLPLLRCCLVSAFDTNGALVFNKAAMAAFGPDAVYGTFMAAQGKGRVSAAFASARAAARASASTRFSDSAAFAAARFSPEQSREIVGDATALQEGLDPRNSAIWAEGKAPDWFRDADAKMRALWHLDRNTRWEFWERWWDGAIRGEPLDPNLQLAVAHGIDEVTWKDPDNVAARIVEIEARFKLDQVIAASPHAWRIALDHKTGLFNAYAIETRDLSEIVAGVSETISEFHRRCKLLKISNFGQSVQLAFKPVIDTLRRDLRRHADAPYSLFKSLEYARVEMEEIAQVEMYAGESYVSRFFKMLDDHAEDICLNAPEVVEQLKAKAALRYELCTVERRMMMMRQTLGLHLDAEGILKRAALEALVVLQDAEASDARKKDAFYFCTAILPRAARAYLAEKDETGEAPKGSKASRAKRIVDAADALSKLDKGKDALVENVPDMYEGAQSLLEFIDSNAWPF